MTKRLNLWESKAEPQVLVYYAGFSDQEPAWRAEQDICEDILKMLSKFFEWIGENGA